jgi:hypothetical protein
MSSVGAVCSLEIRLCLCGFLMGECEIGNGGVHFEREQWITREGPIDAPFFASPNLAGDGAGSVD